MADRSKIGWSTVCEYLSDDLASNSKDEKRIFRSESRAERCSKQAASQRSISARSAKSFANSAHSSPARSASTSGLHPKNSASRIGPCYKLSICSYFQSFFIFFFICCFFPMLAHLLFRFVYFSQCWFPRHTTLFAISLFYLVGSMVR